MIQINELMVGVMEVRSRKKSKNKRMKCEYCSRPMTMSNYNGSSASGWVDAHHQVRISARVNMATDQLQVKK